MDRISKGVFVNGPYTATFSRTDGYLQCNCEYFSIFGKCPHCEEAKAVLQSEGHKVTYRRVPKPNFIDDIEMFRGVIDVHTTHIDSV